MITASSCFNEETARALAYLRFYGRREPQKRFRMWTVFYFVMIAVLVGEMVLFGPSTLLWGLLALAVLVLGGMTFLFRKMPGIQYEKFGELKDTETRYLFGPDRLLMTTSIENYVNSYPVEYTDLESVYETDRYLFIYNRKRVMYIVDKDTVAEEKLPELSALLKDAAPKYVRCEY